MTDRTTRNGLLLAVGAFASWGLLPLYLKLLGHVPAAQVLSHRILWSLLLLGAIVLVVRQGRQIAVAARGRTLAMLCASAALIAVNWYVYIWAIEHAHVLEASLGYFINPLVNVALGVAVLGERVSRVQKIAVGVAAAGVAVMAASGGGAIWISLVLATSFGTYGLIRTTVAVGALGGLTIETLILAPFALAMLVHSGRTGTAAWGQDVRTDLLLVLAGGVTAAPLLMFAGGARRLRYTTMGLLQYIAPTLQFLEAVLLFGERLRPVHAATFALIWTGCALYAVDGWRGARRERVGEPT